MPQMFIRRIIEALRNLVTRFRTEKGPGATARELDDRPTEQPRDSTPGPPHPISARPSNQERPDSLPAPPKNPSNANPKAAAPTPTHTTIASSPDQSGQEKTEGSLPAPSEVLPNFGTDPPSEASEQFDSSDVSKEVGNSSSPEETRVAPDPAPPGRNQQSRLSRSTHDMHPRNEGPNEENENEPHSAEDASAVRKPREIGGRRGRSFSAPKQKGSQAPNSRPELFCRLENGVWRVFLSAADDCPISAVHLNGSQLDSTRGEYRLPSLIGRVSVSLDEGRTHEVPLFEGDPLIFKLRNGWSGTGRRIPRITKGHFIVLAPVIWERTGRAPVEAEHCADKEFRAHYFYRNNETQRGDSGGFREWEGQTFGENVIKLSGNAAYDNSDEGELFVGEAPSLVTPPGIEWARVGQEEERGWGANFQPNEESLSATLDGREGRFSLGHELVTDVVRLRFPGLQAEWVAYSLAYAVLLGAADTLQVPDTDLNVTITGGDQPGESAVVLYDNVPGGAGLVAQLEDEGVFANILRAAMERVQGNCGCDSSCYGCLRSYRNQFAHPYLNRHDALRILARL